MVKRVDFVQAWFSRVWDDENPEAIHEMMQADTHAQGLRGHVLVGPEEFAVFHGALMKIFTDWKFTIVKHVDDGAWIAAMLHVTAKRRDNDAPIDITGQILARVSDNKIYECYNQFDFMRMFEQAGLLPEKTMEACMAGEGITT